MVTVTPQHVVETKALPVVDLNAWLHLLMQLLLVNQHPSRPLNPSEKIFRSL